MITIDIILITSALGLLAMAGNLFIKVSSQVLTLYIRIEKLEWKIRQIENYLITKHDYVIKSTEH